MSTSIAAIPTTYAGVNFRSRLEARYAAFFDIVGWKWEYEPVDLEGWIPDFRVTIPCEKCDCEHALLVEVKPHYNIDNFRDTPEYALAMESHGAVLPCDAVALFGQNPSVSYWEIHWVGETSEWIPAWVDDWADTWKQAGNMVQWRGIAQKRQNGYE